MTESEHSGDQETPSGRRRSSVPATPARPSAPPVSEPAIFDAVLRAVVDGATRPGLLAATATAGRADVIPLPRRGQATAGSGDGGDDDDPGPTAA